MKSVMKKIKIKIRKPTLLERKDWLIKEVLDKYGKLGKDTIVRINNYSYILSDGWCDSCDLKSVDCWHKPFDCDKVTGLNVCLKKLKGGI